ncbi:MAG: YiiX/YebB-like N1pC/P60 family cysteine hydrolase [Gammaproteobacteria bacterium]
MEFGLKKRVGSWLTRWLTKELHEPDDALLYDFDRLCYEIRPGDVILVEGRSRVSDVIKLITQSPWTHAALYIGRLYDIHDPHLQTTVREHYDGDPQEPLIIEALLGEGTVIHPLSKYHGEHLRICRPKGLAHTDARKVIAFAIGRLGTGYDVRQLLDLARFMFPFWAFLPRRWRSSLFERNAGQPTRTVCSSMLGEAFSAVHFPVLPFVERTTNGKIHLYKRNPRLFTPRDFDYSPYFEIIKYPFFGLDDVSIYQRLPWGNIDEYCNDIDDCYLNPPRENEPANLNPTAVTREPTEPPPVIGRHFPRAETGLALLQRPAPAPQQVNLLTALSRALSTRAETNKAEPAAPVEKTARDAESKEAHSV